MSKIGYFHYVKNKIDKFRHFSLYSIRKSKRCDVAIILRQLKFKKSQSPHSFHYERKKVFELMFVLESKRKGKIKSRSFRPLATFITSTLMSLIFNVLAVYIPSIRNNQNLFITNRYSPISCIKRQKYRDIRGRHSSVIDV